MANNIAVSITADVADLQVKRAIMSAELKTASKDLNTFAKDAAVSGITDEMRTSMLAAADTVARLKNQVAAADVEIKKFGQSQQAVTGMSAQNSAALKNLSFQINDVATGLATGQPPMMIFAQQGSQIVQALQMMEGGGNKFIKFLSGPWGMALTAATVVVAPLIANLLKTNDAEKALVEKMKEDAKTTEQTRQAKAVFEKTVEGVTAAIYDQKAALDKQEESLKTANERALESARTERARELQIRKTTIALLEQAEAQLAVVKTQASFGAQGSGGANMVAVTVYSNQVADLKKAKAEADKAMITAQANFMTAQSNMSVETGKKMGDPVEAIRKKYEGSDGLIEQARKRAVAEGKVGEALQSQVQALTEQEKKEIKQAQKDGRDPKAKQGPDIVSQWAEQLHAQEIASGEFFKDNTAGELKFWQSKLGQTKEGSKDWLAVQARIYEAARTLAQRDYQDHLAGLNDRIEADRNVWSQEKADWDEKLSYIGGKFGEESAEYKNAHREFERAQRQHDDREMQAAQQHATRMIEIFRQGVDAQTKLRDDDAKAAELGVRANSGASPFGDIGADLQISQIHATLMQQKMADNEAFYARQTAELDGQIAAAQERYGEDKARYQSLLDEKAKADEQYAAKKRELESQSRMQSIQDILAVRSAYHGYVDGIVSSSVSAFDGILSEQKTWAQAGISIYGSVVHMFEQQIAQMASRWIVEHVFMTAAQRAQLAAQTAQHMGAEAAKTAATAAGTASRVATTAAGATTTAAITTKSNLKEITSHAATAAAGAYKAMASIPVVGPVLGALAAAATFTAVEAYGALASFDKGTNVLPNDMIAQVHAGERIVPKADNDALIRLTARGAGMGGETRQGDMNVTYAPTVNGQLPFADQLEAHESNMIAILQRAHRRGALRFAK